MNYELVCVSPIFGIKRSPIEILKLNVHSILDKSIAIDAAPNLPRATN